MELIFELLYQLLFILDINHILNFEQVKFVSGELKNKLKLKKTKQIIFVLHTQEHLKRNTKKQLAF